MRLILTALALATIGATVGAPAHASGPRPTCQTDAQCGLGQVCDRPVGKQPRPGKCVRDALAPVAALAAPPRYVNTRSVRVDGTARDNRWVQDAWFALGGRRVPATYAAAPQLTATALLSLAKLPDGAYPIGFYVRDAAGNAHAANQPLILDTRAPRLALVTPAQGASVATSDVTVALTVSELNPAEIRIGATTLHHPGSRSALTYTVSLALAEGAQALDLVAEDAAGNVSTLRTKFVVDLTPPAVALADLPGYVNSPQLTVSGAVSDKNGVTDARFFLDGEPVATRFLPSGDLASAELTLGDADGAHVIELRASDAAGHEVSAWGQLIYDHTAPKFALLAPAEGEVFGTTEVPASVAIKELSPAVLTLGGEGVVHPGGVAVANYAAQLTRPEGPHAIVATAVDSAGNAVSVTHNVVVDLTAPAVTTDLQHGLVVVETCGAPQPDNLYLWSFEVSDLTDTTLASLVAAPYSEIDIIPGATRTAYTVNVQTALEPGLNVLGFVVQDAAGHATTISATVTFVPLSLDDGDACTVDSCDPATGVVTHADLGPLVLSMDGTVGGIGDGTGDANLYVAVDPSTGEAVGTWPKPTATDCLGAAVPVTCVPPSGASFPLGTTVVTCAATDFQGETVTSSFYLTAFDGPGPWELLAMRDQATADRGLIGGAGAQAAQCLAISPTHPNHMALGIDTARVFVSDNGGQDWVPRSEGIVSLGVHALAFAPDDPDVIWAAATGEDNGTPNTQDGIYRSANLGLSWTLMWPAKFPRRDPSTHGERNTTTYFAFAGSADAPEDTVFVATYDQGLLKGTRAGGAWTWTFDGPTADTSCPLIHGDLVTVRVLWRHPQDGDLWLAGNAGLCHRGPNAGDAWEGVPLTAGGAPLSKDVRSFAAHPGEVDLLFVALGESGVFKSTTGGQTWTSVGLPVGIDPDTHRPWDWASLDMGAVSAGGPFVVYAEPDVTSKWGRSSVDGGLTWHEPTAREGGFLDGRWHARGMATHPTDPMVAFMGNPVRRTVDGGQTWTVVSNGFDGMRRGAGGRSAVAFHPTDPLQMMFFHTDHGATVTDDGGRTWARRDAPPQPGLATVTQPGGTWDPATGRVVSAVGAYDDQRLCTSDDGGGTWNTTIVGGKAVCTVPGGISYDPCSRTTFGYFAQDPDDAGGVYAARTTKWPGAADVAGTPANEYCAEGPDVDEVLRSDDAGDHWVVVKAGVTLQAMDPLSGDLYATERIPGQTQVWKSTDHGSVWSAVGPAFNCGNATALDVAGSDGYVACSGGVWAFHGTSWLRHATGVDADFRGEKRLTEVAVDRRNAGVVYTAQRTTNGHAAGVFRSVNAGQSWENINANLGSALNIWGLAVSPLDSSVLIATDRGSFRLQPRDLPN